jgi:cytochrome c553
MPIRLNTGNSSHSQKTTNTNTMKTTTLIRAALAATLTLTLASLTTRAADAAATWKTKCAACHGADGKGKAALHTKDFTSADVQAALTDEAATKAITDGVTTVKPPMGAFKDKLSADEIQALVAYVRALKQYPIQPPRHSNHRDARASQARAPLFLFSGATRNDVSAAAGGGKTLPRDSLTPMPPLTSLPVAPLFFPLPILP